MNARSYILSLILLGSVATGGSLHAADLTVDGILDRYVTAVGGKEALEKLTSLSMVGDLEAMGNTTPTNWQLHAKAPSKRMTHVDFAGFGVFEDVCDGTSAWSKNPNDGVRVKDGDELFLAKAEADIHRALHMKTLYPKLELKGTQKLDGEDVQVLESTATPTCKVKFLFSAKSGLMVQQIADSMGPQGKVQVTYTYSDYKPVEGVQQAHGQKMKMDAGGQGFEIGLTVKSIKANVDIPDAKFAKPSA